MRISAIRGSNLASLAGDFELLLDQDPLGQVGLFAITGPTGSGKSTLLDCICLALYDRMPRLQVASRNSKVRASLDEDAEEMSATDPRLILRRGTGEGFAEVEFHDAEGVRYRSRWSVRRAYGKADGRVQGTEMSLWAADGSVIAGGGKREVLDAIEARVGLGFEQFLRSALLAQGAFAAFLHADPLERATVLERVTGTEIYRRISQATFERFRQEESKLAGITQRLEDVGVLAAEERAELIARRERLAAEATEREAAVVQAREALGWHRRDADLKSSLQQAGSEVQAAEAAWEGLEAGRARLERAEALEPLRPAVEAVERGRQRVRDAEKACEGAQAALDQTDRSLDQARTRETEAREQEAALAVAWEQGATARDRARTLDARLDAAREQAAKATARATTARQAVRPLEQALERAEADARAVTQAAEAAEAWFDAHPGADALRLQSESLLRDLGRLEQARDAERTATRELTSLEQRVRDARTEAERLQKALRAAEAARTEADRRLEQAGQALDALDPQALEQRAARISREQDWLGHLEEPARAEASAGEALSTLDTDAEQRSARMEQLGETLQRLQAESPLDAIRLEEARHTLDRLKQAVGLEARRGDLVEGEPCPLCGSPDHPWASHGAPTPGLLDDQQARVAELQAAATRRTATLAAHQAEQEQLRQAHEREQARRREQVRIREQARSTWQAHPAPDSVEPLPARPDLEALRQRQASLRDRKQALEQERRRQAAATQALEQARAQREAARTRAERDQVAFQEERVLGERLRGQASAASDKLTSARDEVERLCADLALLKGLGGFPEAPVPQVRSALQARLGQATAHHEAIEAARRHATESPLEGHRARLEQAREAQQQAAQARDDANSRVTQLQSERAEVLDGRPISEVEAAHQRAAAASRSAVEAAVSVARRAGEARSAARARVQEGGRELAEAREALEQAGSELAERCEQAGLDEAAVRDGLAGSAEDLAALRQQVQQARARLDTARTVQGERARALASHREGHTPPPLELIQQHLGKLEAEKRRSQQERAQVDAQLAADAAARARAEALAAEHQAQAAVLDTWSRLSKLIGSRDGRTFKRFAQSLTLDALLAHANRHLDDLAPRYRLVRVPGSELDLQVIDRHMGDEIRGVHTLSGGESFLASLALALGLASLSSADTPVETLFIDEGFGTLDRETLDVALAALDALRATGRQVGIISHVAGLAERIGTQVRVVPTGAGRSKVVLARG